MNFCKHGFMVKDNPICGCRLETNVENEFQELIDALNEEFNLNIDAGASKQELANQFVFAYGGYDEDLDADNCFWIITPKAYWEDSGCVYDQESFIGDLLPEDAGDVNGCGTWTWPDDLSPVERAIELTERGFVWDLELQEFLVGSFLEEDESVINEIIHVMRTY